MTVMDEFERVDQLLEGNLDTGKTVKDPHEH